MGMQDMDTQDKGVARTAIQLPGAPRLRFGLSPSKFSYSFIVCKDETNPADCSALSNAEFLIANFCRFTGYSERTYSARSTSIKTHRRPIFAPGMRPRFVRVRTSSGCICRNAAASRRLSVFTFYGRIPVSIKL